MLESQKHVFWQAFLVTVLLFGIGVFLGIVLENARVGKINTLYQISEVNLLDVQLQNQIYSLNEFNCSNAVKENIYFADRIFEEAKQLERYETSSRLTESIILQHKKYDLLRTILFLNSIKIKEICKGHDYSEVVYFYSYDDTTYDVRAQQSVFSRLLKELKEEKGDKVLLIPIAADTNLSAVNIILNTYDISYEELPVILIDRKIKINEILTLDQLKDRIS